GRLDRALSDDTKAIIQRVTEYGYQQFISSVAAARGKSVEDIDRIARGRVWSGKDALRLGLVDELGTLDDAIAAVAVRAGLGDDYGVRFVEKPLSFQERLALSFATRAQIWFGEDVFVSKRERSLRRISAAIGLDRLQSELDALARFNDPQGIYAYCFCRVD
ncbi:MAG: S49 family peptidase, partial [Pseudomonadota bacterium]